MVTVFLRGGLGNQMFQYALGLALAKRNKTKLLLDSVFLCDRFPRKNFTYRTFDLDVFALEPRFTALSKIANAIPVPGLWLGADLAFIKSRDFFGVQKIVKEKNEQAFDPEILRSGDNLLLWGRWQNEKYFSEVADEVRAAFRFRHPFEGEAKALAEKIRSCNSVSLHVRRGDFASSAVVKDLMGDTNLSYYSRAARYIGERVKKPELFVFSDDIEWCKKNITVPFPATYATFTSEGPKASFHLHLMSLCKHNIIANSTFSWWGAWLNNNPGKIVIAPKQWYADGTKTDILPEKWIKL